MASNNVRTSLSWRWVIITSRAIWKVSLILIICSTFGNRLSMRRKLTLRVSMSLLLLLGWSCSKSCSLTCSSVSIYLFFVKIFYFLWRLLSICGRISVSLIWLLVTSQTATSLICLIKLLLRREISIDCRGAILSSIWCSLYRFSSIVSNLLFCWCKRHWR